MADSAAEGEDIFRAKKSVDLVRVACTSTRFRALDMVKDAKDKAMKTLSNLMASHLPEFELNKGLELIGKSETIWSTCGQLRSLTSRGGRSLRATSPRWQGQTGRHSPHTSQMAYVNTIFAAIPARELDSTSTALARRGQLPTGIACSAFLAQSEFHQRRQSSVEKMGLCRWRDDRLGYSIPYMITGQMNEHPRLP